MDGNLFIGKDVVEGIDPDAGVEIQAGVFPDILSDWQRGQASFLETGYQAGGHGQDQIIFITPEDGDDMVRFFSTRAQGQVFSLEKHLRILTPEAQSYSQEKNLNAPVFPDLQHFAEAMDSKRGVSGEWFLHED